MCRGWWQTPPSSLLRRVAPLGPEGWFSWSRVGRFRGLFRSSTVLRTPLLWNGRTVVTEDWNKNAWRFGCCFLVFRGGIAGGDGW